MDISEILKQQQAALDALQQQLAKPGDSGLLSLLGNREQQAAAIQARIDELSRQKDDTMRRYDAAINEQKNLLATLQSVIADTERILQSNASSNETRTNKRPTARRKRQ
jgi:hypothetical protein